jgi:hypothetical protein
MLSAMAVAATEVGAPLEDFDSVVRLYRSKIFRYMQIAVNLVRDHCSNSRLKSL